jgi:hypothetical protein
VEISWLEPAVFATSRLLLYLYAEHLKRMVQAKDIAAISMAACLLGCGYAILDTDALRTISEKASARWAACSSRAMLGDRAGLPPLTNAPCPHCEQISTRGSDSAAAGVVARASRP